MAHRQRTTTEEKDCKDLDFHIPGTEGHGVKGRSPSQVSKCKTEEPGRGEAVDTEQDLGYQVLGQMPAVRLNFKF